MHDDELMDRLVRDALAGAAPQLSPAFDARVIRRVQPRRLTTMGRLAIAIYVVLATATAAWLMQDLPIVSIVAAVTIGAALAAGTSIYARRLAFGD